MYAISSVLLMDYFNLILQYNKFKQRIINEKVTTPTTTVYRYGWFIMTESAYNKYCIPLNPYKTYMLLKAFCQT